jgi:glycosyltransferase involved in cell wall biosynthesis
MKIIFFARRFYPLIGGVEKHVFELSQRLIQKGHTIIVLTELDEKETLPKHEVYKNIRIYRIKTGKDNTIKKFRIWKELWECRDLIAAADIIHCHDIFFWYLPFRFLYVHKKVFITFHGYESYPISQKAIIIRKLSEVLSYGNICIGDFIEKWYKTKPTAVSYGAVDLQSKKQVARSKPTNESAVFVGRLDDQTGILTYTKALVLVRKKYPKFSLVAVGDGVYKNKIAKKVLVTGFQENPEIYLYKAHFAFISRYLAILEAFIAKRLVFAVYDNPVKEDYLKLAPFAKCIVIAKSAEELSEKIMYYLDHPQQEKKLIEEAYLWGVQQTWSKMANLYISLWNRV